ncbi:MAG TPA: hypothetical protein VFL78_02885 [Rhodanobacteraceae bacterium]|nr:hypothetical protein [Rhodanobacteraceae bacterium]
MIARAGAGVLLGFPLAAALLALALIGLPRHGQAWVIPALIAFFPLWTALMAGSFFFRDGRRAWLALGIANLLAFTVLWLLRMMGL